jgi:multiple sugar transport system substrate-binding protein
MQCKRLTHTLVFLIMTAALPGCGGCSGRTTAPLPTASTRAGVALKVACPADSDVEFVRQRGHTWGGAHGGSVTVVEYPRAGEPPAADVWVVRAAEMPRWAAPGKLLALPASVRADGKYEWNRLLPLYRGKLLLWGATTPYALPLLGESPLCFYRTDLLDDPAAGEEFRKQTGKPLTPPTTWEDFARVAEFFRGRKTAGLAETPLPPLPDDPEALDRLFYQTAAPFVRLGDLGKPAEKADDADLFSFHYDLKTGKPRLREAGFREALKLQQRLQACRPKGTAADPAAEFAAGRAVLCLADAPALERFRKSAVWRKVGVCRVPGAETVFDGATGERRPVDGGNHVGYVGAATWLAVVPTAAEHPEAAWDFLSDLTGPEKSRQAVMEPSHGGGATREGHLETPGHLGGFRLGQAQTQKLLEALRQTLGRAGSNSVVRLRIPDERSHLEALTAELRKALLEGKDAAAALESAASAWEELDRKRGPAHLADYYRSLALEPR